MLTRTESQDKAIRAHNEAHADLWVAVMKHYDEVPEEVKVEWLKVQKASNAVMAAFHETDQGT